MPPIIKHFSDISDMREHAVNHIVAKLNDDVKSKRSASLIVSGGSTPGPVYEQLSHFDLSWDKISVALVDERWVDETSTGSNTRLVRNTLLQNKAANAKFVPMKTNAEKAKLGQAEVEDNYAVLPLPYSVVVLGMGIDGHMASWFAGGAGYTQAISPDNTNLVQAIKAIPSNVTGEYLDRMTMTRHAIAHCDFAILLITGDKKMKVFNEACAGKDYPIRYAIEDLGKRLCVLTCP